MFIQEIYLNATEGYAFGESDVYEAYTDDRGELFRIGQREYGRCVSKVYVDGPNGPRAIGWVFQGRQLYEDTNEPYLREVWVTLHLSPPTKTVTHHYAAEDGPLDA